MEKLMAIAGLIFIAALVSACSATYKQNVLLEPSPKLVNGKSVLIATLVDRWYGKIEYAGSGRIGRVQRPGLLEEECFRPV